MVKTCNTREGIKHGDAAGKRHNEWANVYTILL